jgi:hypothetical protein
MTTIISDHHVSACSQLPNMFYKACRGRNDLLLSGYDHLLSGYDHLIQPDVVVSKE